MGGFYSIVQKCPRDESPAHEPWQQQDVRGKLTAPRWESWAFQSLCISVSAWSFLKVNHFSSSSNKAWSFWALGSLFKAWLMLAQKANEADSRFERSPAPTYEMPTLSALAVWCHLQSGCWALKGVLETPPHTHPSFLSLILFIASLLFLMFSSDSIFVVVLAPAQAYREDLAKKESTENVQRQSWIFWVHVALRES